MARGRGSADRAVAQNRRAWHDYTITDSFEAGLVLQGTEVKSLREGRASLKEAYAAPKDGEIYLINAHIPEYSSANRFNHEPRRRRKILVHKRQLNKLLGEVKQAGVTLVPLKIYFNDRGIAKLQLGVATGKRKYEKRQAEKEKDWKREKARLLREKG